MIADFDDFRTWMYVLISDLFAPLAAQVARPGPAPACTAAELITMANGGEWWRLLRVGSRDGVAESLA